jgi:hypothetical protein
MREAAIALAAVLCGLAGPAAAEDIAVIPLAVQDHRFVPAEIHVVSGKPAVLEITNRDDTPEEFECGILAIEHVIQGGGHARIRLRPLAPGRYNFIGDFHRETASGVIVSEAAR